MKTYDLRDYAISEIVELVKGYRDCKIILNSWQHKKLPLHQTTFFQLCSYRGISFEIYSGNTHPKNCVSNLDFSSVQPITWSNAEDWTTTTSIGSKGYVKKYIGNPTLFNTGLPHSVNFVEKHKRTTLVWKNVFGEFETTKSEAHDEKFDYLYGFLMAYFKRVHRDKSKTQLKKYLNAIVYPMTKKEQTAFLQGIFYENCGLGFKEAKEYLEKIKVKK